MEAVAMSASTCSAFWRDRRVFVTGATGLVGSWLIRALLDRGADLIALVRDYIYVEDAVKAYLVLAEQLAANVALAGEAFNFSNETQLTVRALVDRIVGLMGADLTPMVLSEATHEIAYQHLDASKARRMLGWCPVFGLDEGLKRTIAWYREHLDLAL
jgi:nucleoside-diphosphate-sugar epimerase